jgi:hypothetical protein
MEAMHDAFRARLQTRENRLEIARTCLRQAYRVRSPDLRRALELRAANLTRGFSSSRPHKP